jgi:redox-sensitive bicupin YhaK (pirin superfamily)
MKHLTISQPLTVQTLKHGSGFKALGIRGETDVLDPFLMVDHFWMSQPTFGAHPHAGFSAVTYMFDDAQTGFQNRDSLGDASIINPGDLHWTIAGAGVVHDEVPITPGLTAHGLQMFVNLPAVKKQMAPGALHVNAEHMPKFEQSSGVKIKLVFGAYDDGNNVHDSIQALPTDATLLDVNLAADTAFGYPVLADKNTFLIVVKGEISVDGQTLQEGSAVAFSKMGGLLQVNARSESQFVVLMGKPLREPVVRHGPFAMSTQEDLVLVMAAFKNGELGEIKNTES